MDAIILAAGEGSRIKNNTRKQFLELNGLPVAMHSVRAFNQADPETIIYIALPNRHKLVWKKLCQKHHFKIKHKIYIGGDSRAETVLKGLKQIYKDSAFAVRADDNQKNNTPTQSACKYLDHIQTTILETGVGELSLIHI